MHAPFAHDPITYYTIVLQMRDPQLQSVTGPSSERMTQVSTLITVAHYY